jgi:membrane protein
MAPAMVGGALLGTFIAARIPAHYLQLFFVAFVCAIALQMLCRYRPQTGRHLPGTAGICLSGGVIGLLSSWVGIGGGTLSVPFMLRGNVPVHQAIGTSGALAWPMALSGAVGYLLAGWHVTDLPSGSLGYCYLPAAAVLALSTLCLTPVGVKIAHRLPDSTLQRAFGLYLLIIAAHMLWKVHPHF